MNRLKILISGASIAGPTLAHWLSRFGAAVTVVEQAPALRDGGHGVDFRGAQMELLDRMGITHEIRRRETGTGSQLVVDAAGRPVVELPSFFFSGEVEIARGDLAQVLHELTHGSVEYRFGESVTALTESGDGVDVAFRASPTRRFDLVIGADGMHSAVRALTFGEEGRFATFQGHYAAGFTAPNILELDHRGMIYNEPGLAVMAASGRDPATMGVQLLFRSERLRYDRHDTEAVRAIVADRFAGAGWATPQVIEQMWRAPEMYFDPLQQIRLERWSRGRVALLGDAAWCAGPGGSGTGAAMMGAYILAAELADAHGDHRIAFPRYQQVLARAAAKGQWQAKDAGSFLAPPTAARLRRRNRAYRLMSSRLLARPFAALVGGAANAVTLKDHPQERDTERTLVPSRS